MPTKKRTQTAASKLTLSQIRAVGRMTINFNWLEHSLEVMIASIIGATAENVSLREQVIKPLGFRQKLTVLRGLVAALEEHYVRSVEMDSEYALFANEVKTLCSTAEKLNDFRNSIVHWRPFIVAMPFGTSRPKFLVADAPVINAKSDEMFYAGSAFFVKAFFLHDKAGVHTFGSHMKTKTP